MPFQNFIDKISLTVNCFTQIRKGLTFISSTNLQGKVKQNLTFQLQQIWENYEKNLMDGLIREMDAKIMEFIRNHKTQSDSSIETSGRKGISNPSQTITEEEIWKKRFKALQTADLPQPISGEDLTEFKKKYLESIMNDQDSDDQSLQKYLSSGKKLKRNQHQTFQKSVQVQEYFGTVSQSSLLKKQSVFSRNSPQQKKGNVFTITSVPYTSSPVNSFKEYEQLSSPSRMKMSDNNPLLSSADQSFSGVNYHKLVLDSVNILIVVLRNMEYLLPIDYISKELDELMEFRNLTLNKNSLQERQFLMVQNAYKKVIKRMKHFRNQLKKDHQKSKLVNFNQNIVLKVI